MEDSYTLIIRAVVALGLVVLLVFLLGLVLRWRRGSFGLQGKNIRVTRTLGLGGKNRLIEVVWRGKILLLAATAEGVNIVSELGSRHDDDLEVEAGHSFASPRSSVSAGRFTSKFKTAFANADQELTHNNQQSGKRSPGNETKAYSIGTIAAGGMAANELAANKAAAIPDAVNDPPTTPNTPNTPSSPAAAADQLPTPATASESTDVVASSTTAAAATSEQISAALEINDAEPTMVGDDEVTAATAVPEGLTTDQADSTNLTPVKDGAANFSSEQSFATASSVAAGENSVAFDAQTTTEPPEHKQDPADISAAQDKAASSDPLESQASGTSDPQLPETENENPPDTADITDASTTSTDDSSTEQQATIDQLLASRNQPETPDGKIDALDKDDLGAMDSSNSETAATDVPLETSSTAAEATENSDEPLLPTQRLEQAGFVIPDQLGGQSSGSESEKISEIRKSISRAAEKLSSVAEEISEGEDLEAEGRPESK